MGKECLKCGYVRQADDVAPAYECPRCRAIYEKVEAAAKRGRLVRPQVRAATRPIRSWKLPGLRALVTAVGIIITGALVALLLMDFRGADPFGIDLFGTSKATLDEIKRTEQAARERLAAEQKANTERANAETLRAFQYGRKVLGFIDHFDFAFTDFRDMHELDRAIASFETVTDAPRDSKFSACTTLSTYAKSFLSAKRSYYAQSLSVAAFSQARREFAVELHACEEFVGARTLVGQHLLF